MLPQCPLQTAAPAQHSGPELRCAGGAGATGGAGCKYCGLSSPRAHPAAHTPPHAPRAYKLGKKRWSYNQVELVLREGGGGGERTAAVVQAIHAAGRSPQAHQASKWAGCACAVRCCRPNGAQAAEVGGGVRHPAPRLGRPQLRPANPGRGRANLVAAATPLATLPSPPRRTLRRSCCSWTTAPRCRRTSTWPMIRRSPAGPAPPPPTHVRRRRPLAPPTPSAAAGAPGWVRRLSGCLGCMHRRCCKELSGHISYLLTPL